MYVRIATTTARAARDHPRVSFPGEPSAGVEQLRRRPSRLHPATGSRGDGAAQSGQLGLETGRVHPPLLWLITKLLFSSYSGLVLFLLHYFCLFQNPFF